MANPAGDEVEALGRIESGLRRAAKGTVPPLHVVELSRELTIDIADQLAAIRRALATEARGGRETEVDETLVRRIVSTFQNELPTDTESLRQRVRAALREGAPPDLASGLIDANNPTEGGEVTDAEPYEPSRPPVASGASASAGAPDSAAPSPAEVEPSNQTEAPESRGVGSMDEIPPQGQYPSRAGAPAGARPRLTEEKAAALREGLGRMEKAAALRAARLASEPASCWPRVNPGELSRIAKEASEPEPVGAEDTTGYSLIGRLRAASHDERLSTGALYTEAANEIERLAASEPEQPPQPSPSPTHEGWARIEGWALQDEDEWIFSPVQLHDIDDRAILYIEPTPPGEQEDR